MQTREFTALLSPGEIVFRPTQMV